MSTMPSSTIPILTLILSINIIMASSSSYHVQVDTTKECSCTCPGTFASDGRTVCKKLFRLEEELFYVKGVIEKRNKYVKDLEDLKERMELQEVLFENLLRVVEDLKKRDKVEILPTPEALVENFEENMLGDSSGETRLIDDRDLFRNMSSLLAKVEVVEHLTTKVQEELKSERRVRRHLEEDLNETRTSIKLLDDKLQNASFPMEYRDDIIEEIMISTLQNLNNTFFSEHLQKLHYRLDGVAYKNETNLMISLMMNATELMHGGMDEIWKDVQDLRNYTDQIKKEMYEQDNSSLATTFEIFENFTSEISRMKIEIAEVKNPISSLNHQIGELATDLALTENRITGLELITDNRLNEMDLKFNNVSEVLLTSVATIADRISNLNKDTLEELVMGSTCSLPETDDPHLLVSLETDSSGRQSLAFGCHPIGRYALDIPSAEVTCVDGEWQGRIPECLRLLDEHEVNGISAEFKTVDPCIYSFGNIPDPFDCSRYFTCSPGKTYRKQCPPGQHFSPSFKFCEPVEYARCQPAISTTDKLQDIVPSILINKDTVDGAYSMTGTGPRGELIVYPRAGFTLECFYPDTVWGPATWRFFPGYSTGKDIDLNESGYQSLVSTRLGPNRIIASVSVAAVKDSGVYVCVTPRGKMNWIAVVVKDVHCPPIPVKDAGPQNPYYRPHPEGEYRILSTPVEFHCRGGVTIAALCRADGTWSRDAPTREECPQEDVSFWGCPVIDTSDNPDLILERDDRDATVTFRCAGSTRLIGNAFTRCYEGAWTHTRLPTCAPRTY